MNQNQNASKLYADSTLHEAVELFRKGNIKILPVVDHHSKLISPLNI